MTDVLLLSDCCSFFVLFDLAVRSGVADVSLFFKFAKSKSPRFLSMQDDHRND